MKKIVLLSLLLLFGAAVNRARADHSFSGLAVFGDSLSSEAYFGGGSGHNWPYFFRPEAVEAGGWYTNQAVGGMTSSEILGRINGYLGSHPVLDPEALYVVYGGINDSGTRSGNIFNGATALHRAGAGYVLVPNLHHTTHHSDIVIEGFNANLRRAFRGTGANVIMADNCSLIDELNADPSSYGFGSDPVLTDGLHFSSRTSAIVAQYFDSVIQAPILISVLPEFPAYAALLNNEKLDSIISHGRLDSHGTNWSYGSDPEFSFYAEAEVDFIDIDSRDDFDSAEMTDLSLLLAAAYPLIDDVETGVGLNLAYGAGEFGDGAGDFGMLNGILSLFAGFEIEKTVPVTAVLSLGLYDFNDVTRSVDLGSRSRDCSGSTTAFSFGLAAKGRYDFHKTEESEFGASLGLDYERISVDGYSESGSSSTSMDFGDQDVNKTTLSGGLFYDFCREYDWAEIRYELRGEYLYFVSDDSRTLSAKVSSFDNEFEMPAYSADGEGMARLALGADFTLTSGLDGACAYQLMYGSVAMINSLRFGLKF